MLLYGTIVIDDLEKKNKKSDISLEGLDTESACMIGQVIQVWPLSARYSNQLLSIICLIDHS